MQKLHIGGEKTAESSLKELLNELQMWLNESYSRHEDLTWMGKHDEGTYLTSWREYFLHTQDQKVVDYAKNMLEKSQVWVEKKLYHGYHKHQEVHHGTEHFTIFLAWLKELSPDNSIVQSQLVNAAENMLNRSKKKPIWYDFDEQLFTSTHLGTKKPGFFMRLFKKAIALRDINIPEHFRLIRMAWLALASGADPELKEIVLPYTRKWADHILNSTEVPVYIGAGEQGDKKFKFALNTFIGAAPKDMNESTRSEIHIANGTCGLFLDVYNATKDEKYLEAGERIMNPILNQIHTPYAHPVADLAWHFYQLEKLPSLDAEIKKVEDSVKHLVEGSYKLELSLNEGVKWKETSFHNTVGIRKDMPELVLKEEGTGDRLEIPSPATMGLLYRASDNETYLQIGLELACAVLAEYRNHYPDGRKHGCGSRAVHAACVGHGRNWGAGYVSTILRAAKGPNVRGIMLPEIDF